MIGELYSDRILAAASSIPAARRLAGADASAKKVSRVCGSEVDVDLKMDGDTVSDFGMEARACALGQAAASIVARHVVGASAAELYQLRDEMKAMLQDGERWADLAVLEPIRDYPQRHASTMLVFEAIAACLDQLSAQHGEA